MAPEGLPLLHQAGSAWGQQHHKDMHCPPASGTFGHTWSHWSQKKKKKGEQEQDSDHNAERHRSGNLLPVAEVPTHKNNKGICGRMKEGKKEEQ